MSQSPNLTKDRAPRETTDSSSSRESSPERATSRKQRSFSPESESSDTAAPQITVRDSSPQADQPVIRQGLAFGTVSTKHINTYEASVKTGDPTFLPGQEVQSTVPGASSSSTSPVAPGPPLSSASSTPGPPPSSSNPATPSPHLSAMSTPSDKSAAQKGTKRATKTLAKKTKQADDTSFTTGRFRLSQYSATPNDGPPVLHGQGPYASVYRTPVSGVEGTPPAPGPETSSSPVAPTPGTRIIMTDPTSRGGKRGSKPQPIQPNMAPLHDEPSNTSPTQARPRSVYPIRAPVSSQLPQSNTIPPQLNPSPRASIPPPGPTSIPSMISPGTNYLPANHPQFANYYRRNYEHESQPPHSDHSRAPSTPIQMNDPRNLDAMMGPPPGESSAPQTKGKEREIPGQRQPNQSDPVPVRPPRGNVRLVTALIEDNRHNPPDHLLAEVYIRCWSGGRPEELWCDAKDLSEALQASASRIDGPAKVFTQRGAYRQCFLRITAEQEDRYNSMNLALASDRTIPISVEYWAPPGAQSKPGADWRMPWHSSPTLSQPHAHTSPQSQSQYHPYQHTQPPPQQQQQQQQHYSQSQQHLSPHTHSQSPHPPYSYQHPDDGRHSLESSRKRPSYNDQGSPEYVPTSLRRTPFSTQASGHAAHDPRYEAPTVSRNTSSSYPRKRHLPEASSPIDNNGQGDGMDTRPDFKAPGFDSSHSEEIRQVISDMIDELMRIDVSVINYRRLNQSPVLLDTVKAYGEVDAICTKYVGRTLPVQGTTSSHKISEVDIARGLGAEDPRRFVAECRETLWLLDLYGERGKRGENPKVLEMLKENYRPDFGNVKPIKQLQKLLRDLDVQWMREHPEGGGENTRSTPRVT